MNKKHNKNNGKNRKGAQRFFAITAAAILVLDTMMTANPLVAMGSAVSLDTRSLSGTENTVIAGASSEEIEAEDNVSEENTSEESVSEKSAAEISTTEENTSEEGNAEISASEENTSEISASEEGSAEISASEEGNAEISASEENTSEENTSEDNTSEESVPGDTSYGGHSVTENISGESVTEDASSDSVTENISGESVTEDASSDSVTENISGESVTEDASSDTVTGDESEDIIVYEEGDEESVIPDKNGSENLDNEEAFSEYVTQELGLREGFLDDSTTEDATDATSDEDNSQTAANEDSAGTALDADTADPAVAGETDADTSDLTVAGNTDADTADSAAAGNTDVNTADEELSESVTDDDSNTESVSSAFLKSCYSSTRLSGYNTVLYKLLKEDIEQVAAGELSYTVFEFSLEEFGLDGLSWSADDLGVSAITYQDDSGKWYITSEAKEALKSYLGISYYDVNKTLLADCPYDLYWYDKTISSTAKSFGYTASRSDGVWRLKLSSSNAYTVKMPVSSDYSSDGNSETYYVNTEIGSSVTEAYNNARSIVAEYSEYNDYKKLDAYRKEICERTSYNSTAIDTGASYGNPWQLIYALDDDTTNQVVCEGYSKAFQYLCDLSTFEGVFKECISVTGYLGDPAVTLQLLAAIEEDPDDTTSSSKLKSKGHMWNIVTFSDDTNYLVDVTNCDGSYVGSGNGGRNLFLVGTGDETSTGSYCTGDVNNGYKFNLSSTGPGYVYDSTAFSRFGEEILTLSEGKITTTDYDLEDAVITLDIPEEGYVYDGTEKTPDVTFVYNGKKLISGEDYTVEYTDNVNAGEDTAKAVITPGDNGCSTGAATKTFSIAKADQNPEVSDCAVSVLDETSVIVSGAMGTLSFTSSDPSVAEIGTEDGVLKGVSAGTATITVACAATDNYNAAQTSFNVTVNARSLTSDGISVTVSSQKLVYSGTAKKPSVTVVDESGVTLTKDTDYTVTYSNNINAGTDTGIITIQGIGNYTDTVTKYFSINKASQSISVSAAAKISVGKTTTLAVSGAKGSVTYTSYNTSVATVSDKGVVKAKKAGAVIFKVRALETDNYRPAARNIRIYVLPGYTTSFKASNLNSGIKLTWNAVSGATGYHIYRGNEKIKVISGKSTVTYTDSKSLTDGERCVYRIYAKSSYGVSTLCRTVIIFRLSRPSITCLKNVTSGKTVIGWAKGTNVNGYQIQYSLNSSFSSARTLTIKGSTSLKKVISNLTRNRVWYFRIRTYRTSGSTTSCSAWSASKKVKVVK